MLVRRLVMLSLLSCAVFPGRSLAGFVYSSEVGVMDIQVADDMKVLAAGTTSGDYSQLQYALARYSKDGVLDPTFGTGGKVFTDVSPACDFIMRTKIDAQKRIIAVGVANDADCIDRNDEGRDIVAARYLPNGELDGSFGNQGLAWLGHFHLAQPRAIVLSPDGKIVVGGWLEKGHVGHGFLARLLGDGSLDPTFGVQGLLVYDLTLDPIVANQSSILGDLLIDPTQTYLYAVGGISGDDAQGKYVGIYSSVTRFSLDGQLDTSFGVNGTAAAFSSLYGLPAMAGFVQPDGKILAASSTDDGAIGGVEGAIRMYRFTERGEVDQSLLNNGFATSRVCNGRNDAARVFLDKDRNMIAVGNAHGHSVVPNTGFADWHAGVANWLQDGSPNWSFSGTGLRRVTRVGATGRTIETANSGALGDGHSIFVGGYTWDFINHKPHVFWIARLTKEGFDDQTWGNAGLLITPMEPPVGERLRVHPEVLDTGHFYERRPAGRR